MSACVSQILSWIWLKILPFILKMGNNSNTSLSNSGEGTHKYTCTQTDKFQCGLLITKHRHLCRCLCEACQMCNRHNTDKVTWLTDLPVICHPRSDRVSGGLVLYCWRSCVYYCTFHFCSHKHENFWQDHKCSVGQRKWPSNNFSADTEPTGCIPKASTVALPSDYTIPRETLQKAEFWGKQYLKIKSYY